MAAKADDKKTTPTADPFADCYSGADDAPPDGYRDESRPDVTGWWKAEPGLVFTGKIVGAFQITKKNRTRSVVLVKVRKPCKAQGEKGPVRLDVGDILGVSINSSLTPMLNYIENQGSVWAKVTGQKDVGQPQPMWVYELRCKGEKSAPPALSEPAGGSDNEDDLPF